MKLSILLFAGVAGCAALQTGNHQPGRISVSGTEFRHADGTPFAWRGITAFRLVEQVASGKEAEAAAYLDWAAQNQVAVVRVLAMAQHLFTLSPADGLRALPKLLDLAAERGMQVEVVALADTAGLPIDLDAHVTAVGAIAGRHANAFVEIANEPFHPTQHPALHDRAALARLAALVPADVLVAYGSDAPANSGGGDYVTVHMPRGLSIGNRRLSGEEEWTHVLALAEGRALVERYARPVVSDEPMGAGSQFEPGQRDNAPERFRAAAILTRVAGMHATFHYEGGLHARIPVGIELACFKAWLQGVRLPPEDIERARRCLGDERTPVLPSSAALQFCTK